MEIVSHTQQLRNQILGDQTPSLEQDPFTYTHKINNDRALKALEKAQSIAARNEKMAQELKSRSAFFFDNSDDFLRQ